MEYHITTPLKDEDIKKLKAGDSVKITGVIYTARDAAHARLVKLLEEGKDLPIDVKGQVIFYVGPTPAKPGRPIGSAGPTTSYRMDAYAPALLKVGLKGMIGKGSRSKEVKDAILSEKAVYFAAVGGTAALIAKSIKKAELITYEDLGAEALRRLEVEDFPAIVINDIYGGDLYEEGQAKWNELDK
ncbi:Fumarate hydratase class I, anaerobic [Fusobacterium sp. DD29]|jgi:fumarate hydratase subunit beta|uniref:Fe-S-containing hydro-lyase n=1 Tax=unclassified Fusobacterium TaxID=2648384 RepID=UPI001B8AC7AD|nr:MULTISPECIES: Fe-S-containing hydro-lyase [unclassified Fusobacterium]MBR8700361.1 Fumarate hydratase class I, anaerobic [Fusobacterium sp. DD45]MBR8710054.1 Fumarate hydratase class I, anaerobic [Fusobacterium sp. DD28]MBR8748354.1 Fumarate hydratase class I, anaerobic [Fusobacterium sp. DD29]MBR8750632.1 Fumarate hydratase class I, anaerobic [Fusobacterium sp. DD26]MBR8760672.1 Fumarate hydratase class I, anaerobic [Fusobacterium sp. DD25]